MILATLLALTLPAQDTNPGQVISKMFAYYHGASSMSGRIKMSQTIQNRLAVIDTSFQFDSPAKIYINQVLTAPYGSDRWLVTGDGVGFTYPPPRYSGDTRVQNRLYEPVQFIPKAPTNKNEAPMATPPPLDLRQIYGIVAKTLGDRSLPIDVAFSRNEDLNYIRKQFATYAYKGQAKIGEADCNVITGRWRENEYSDNGTYTLWITAEGQLKQFERRENIMLKDSNVAGEVVSTWQVEIKKETVLDPKLFTLVLK